MWTLGTFYLDCFLMILENKKAFFDYEVLERFVAGMVLEGWEVKSIRAHSANLKSSWVDIRHGEAFLGNFKVAPWKYSSLEQLKDRERKLLLSKKEINKIERQLNERGVSVIPLKIFEKKGRLKCEIAIAKGRKKYEKRQVLKNRSMEKEARKIMRNY